MLSLKDFRELLFQGSATGVILARDIATIPAIFVTTADNLDEALRLIDDKGIERLPVIRKGDNGKKVVGIISQRDIMSAYIQALKARGLRKTLAPFQD